MPYFNQQEWDTFLREHADEIAPPYGLSVRQRKLQEAAAERAEAAAAAERAEAAAAAERAKAAAAAERAEATRHLRRARAARAAAPPPELASGKRRILIRMEDTFQSQITEQANRYCNRIIEQIETPEIKIITTPSRFPFSFPNRNHIT